MTIEKHFTAIVKGMLPIFPRKVVESHGKNSLVFVGSKTWSQWCLIRSDVCDMM